MRKNSTIKDIAKKADTSIATVSVVLNDKSDKYVSPELRQRVIKTAEELEYRPNIVARRMKGKKGNLLAILVPEYRSAYYNGIITGVEKVIRKEGYSLIVHSNNYDKKKEKKIIENLSSLQVDGILINPVGLDNSSMKFIKKENIPYIVIGRESNNEIDYTSLKIDDYNVSLVATNYLIKNGHSKIAYFSWKDNADHINNRFNGFRQSFSDNKINFDNTIVCNFDEENIGKIREKVKNIIDHKEITAIFVAHNYISKDIVRNLYKLNIKIPEDISIIIYGNPPWAEMTNPGITCIDPQEVKLGKKGAELMIDQINNNSQNEKISIPGKIKMRESVGRIQ